MITANRSVVHIWPPLRMKSATSPSHISVAEDGSSFATTSSNHCTASPIE